MHDAVKRLCYLHNILRRRLVHLNLQLLYQCNFRCRICDFWKEEYRRAPRLSLADMNTIVEKLRPAAPLIVSIGGGEPLIHRELLPIVKLLARDHFPVMICNGWYITPQKARALFVAGLHEISVSIDYADPEKHDAQRGRPGAFKRAVQALKTLQENRTHRLQRVHMISVVMDDNLADIEPLIHLAQKIGVTYLLTLYSQSRGKKADLAARTDVSARLLELHRKYPNFVGIRGYLGRFTEAIETGIGPCYAGKNLFNIDCQGNVSRCIDQLDHVAGNILTDDFPAIRQTLHRQFETGACHDCWTSCRGNFETLMYGRHWWQNLVDGHEVSKGIALGRINRQASGSRP